MGLDCIWNLDLDLDLSRFHLLLLQDCAFLLLVSFYLGHIHARARARTHPLPGPFPPHPTMSVSSILASHPYLCSHRRHHTLRYLPLPLPFLRSFISRHLSHLPNRCQKIALEPLSHILHSHSRFRSCLISIILQGKVAYIVHTCWPGFFSLYTWC